MLVGTRFQPVLLAAIDDWRKAQPDLPTRPEAVRRLVETGLGEKALGAHGNPVTGPSADPLANGDRA